MNDESASENADDSQKQASVTTRAYASYQRLSNGDQAQIRRGSAGAEALWRILYDIDEMDGRADLWRALLVALAHAERHDPCVSFGKALAKARFSKARFVRLMEADQDTLKTALRRCARYLNSKDQAANWNHARQLLFYTGDHAEDVRLRIARDYYRQRRHMEENA
jgi:CRISPR system Cascade subunit CasB